MKPITAINIVQSGHKYRTEKGFTAVKNGIKARESVPQATGRQKKPEWLKVKLPHGAGYNAVRKNVRDHRLATVCEESMCPNIGECWANGTATIMIMGSVCTRACRFCAVDTGNPRGWLDAQEPKQTADSVRLMGLKYVVITSVDRDDLPDGGAAHYAQCVRSIRDMNPETVVEALTPDFRGRHEHIAQVVDSGLQVYAQNLETVERLTTSVRDRRAGYRQTLDVLAFAKQHNPDVLTKTSLMLGLGETEEEILQALKDCKAAGLDIVTFGQYLQPTSHHLPVHRFVPPEDFAKYRDLGLTFGFLEVVSGPFVRSSYRADRVFEKNNAGIEVC